MLFNDGEGLVHDDFNNGYRLGMRNLTEHIIAHYWRPGSETPLGELRPHHDFLEIKGNLASMNVSVGSNGIAYYVKDDTWPTTPEARLLMFPMNSEETGISNIAIDAASAFERWDLISGKLTFDAVDTGSADAVTRDYEDAVTGALTSPTVDKRRRTRLTLTYTPGTVASTDPALPADESVIARIVVPSTATQINQDAGGGEGYVEDLRMPAGLISEQIPLSRAWVQTGSFARHSSGAWQSSAASERLNILLTVPGNPLARHGGVKFEHNRRFRELRFSHGLGASAVVELRRWEAAGAGTPSFNLVEDISSLLTTGSYPQHEVIRWDDIATAALWHTGFKTPSGGSLSGGSWLGLSIVSGAASEEVGPIDVDWWGT
jgi:hypothetical protein